MLVGVFQLDIQKMIDEVLIVLFIARYKGSYVQIRIVSDSQGEVVSLSQDLNSMREVALSTDMLLESSCGSTATLNLLIVETDCQETSSQVQHVWLKHSWIVGSGKGPTDVASSIPDVRSRRVRSLVPLKD